MTVTKISSATTMTAGSLVASPRVDFDFLIRVQASSGSSDVAVSTFSTAEAIRGLKAWWQNQEVERSLLASVIKWQHNLIEYNAHYNAFLLEQIKESEFEAIARQMAFEPRDLDPGILARQIEDVVRLTGIDFSPSDFASMFQATPSSVATAVGLLNAPGYSGQQFPRKPAQ